MLGLRPIEKIEGDSGTIFCEDLRVPGTATLRAVSQLVEKPPDSKAKVKNFYIPYKGGTYVSPLSTRSGDFEDGRYRYKNIEAILRSATDMYRFNADIDNDEEEDLTDDELREKTAERKRVERARRDNLQTVRIAALDTAKSVELVRRRLGTGSILTNSINIEALKKRQEKLREKIDNTNFNGQETETPMKMTATRLNDRSGDLGLES